MAANLPPELLIQVVESLMDDGVAVALQPSHQLTKTLLSVSLVCKGLSFYALKLLYSRCVYISSAEKLALLKRTLGGDSSDLTPAPAPNNSGQKLPRHLLLASFVSGMALHPYQDDTTLFDELDVTTNVATVLEIVAPYLRRLVFDGPLRTVYPGDDHAILVRPRLNAAFSLLTNIEEFASVRDELYLNLRGRDDWGITGGNQEDEPSVWTYWKRLRKLALYNVDMYPDSDFGENAAKVEHLTDLLLTRPDGRKFIRTSLRGCRSLRRAAVLDFTDIPFKPFRPADPNAPMASGDPQILYITGPMESNRFDMFPEEDTIRNLQKWVRERLTDGTAWELPGCKA